MSPILQPIMDEVEVLKTVRHSVDTLIVRFAEQIQNAPTLEEAHAIAAEIRAEHAAFTQLVLDNTPSEDEEEEDDDL